MLGEHEDTRVLIDHEDGELAWSRVRWLGASALLNIPSFMKP